MKAKHVFTTLGLALAMGLGVAAGLSHAREFKQAKADGDVTLYCKMTHGWWKADGAAIGAYYWKSSDENDHNTWPGKRMALVETDTDVWKTTIPSGYDKIIFSRMNPSDEGNQDWGAKTSNLTIPTDGKNLYTISSSSAVWGDPGVAGSWSEYEEPAPTPVSTYSFKVNDEANFHDFVDNNDGYQVKYENVDLKVGDVLTFKKDGVTATINPKKNTKADMVESHFTMLQAYQGDLYLDYTQDVLWVGQYEVEDGYYVFGSMTDWEEIKTAVKMTLTDGVYVSSVFAAKANDTAKAVKVVNSQRSLFYNIKDGTIATSTSAGAVVEGGNVKFTKDTNYVLKIEDPHDDGNDSYATYTVEDNNYAPDNPEKEDTYYIVGSETNWKYAGATEMSTTSIYKTNNTAVLFNYSAKANEEIKVRGVFGGEDKWYGVGGEGGTNYKFTAAGEYDIYLNASKEVYVVSCATRHTIVTTCYKYAGKASEDSFVISQYGYEGTPFTPWVYADGYVCTGIYTSHPSESKYVPEDLAGKTAMVYFYADFMKVGTYLVGNERFAGTGLAWNIKGGQLMTVPASGNKFEAVISITGASEENPVLVKGVDYHADESLDSHYLSWTIAPSSGSYVAPTSVSQDVDGNFVFTENTTFAMYVNQEDKVYFNVGFDAFNTMFLNEIGGVCQNDGSTNPAALAAAWEKVKAAYNNLTAADQKKYNPGKTINDGNETGTDQEKVIAKYKYIVVTKYAGVYEDFIWGNNYGSNRISVAQTVANNTALVVILVSAVAVISAAGLFLVIRRRKHN